MVPFRYRAVLVLLAFFVPFRARAGDGPALYAVGSVHYPVTLRFGEDPLLVGAGLKGTVPLPKLPFIRVVMEGYVSSPARGFHPSLGLTLGPGFRITDKFAVTLAGVYKFTPPADEEIGPAHAWGCSVTPSYRVAEHVRLDLAFTTGVHLHEHELAWFNLVSVKLLLKLLG